MKYNNLAKVNDARINLIALVAQRTMDKVLQNQSAKDILAAPSNKDSLDAFNENVAIVISNKMRSAFTI
jgi:hypothetical protein